MVSLLALSAVDREFERWSGQTKDYAIGILCRHVAPLGHITLILSQPVLAFNIHVARLVEKQQMPIA
jgi:hypothetical protein